MGFQSTPRGERLHIGIFGRINSGKSSIINAITGQELSIVSEIRGTTTDPVFKAMELLPLGPVVMMDTPGLDDQGELGKMRIEKTRQVMEKSDLALVVISACEGIEKEDEELIDALKEKGIPYIIVLNKTDLLKEPISLHEDRKTEWVLPVSARTQENIHELKELMGKIMSTGKKEKRILADLISPKDIIILVVPIDSAAPKGRIILPQQQVLREILDARAQAIVVQVEELKDALESVRRKPRLVITDSQAFSQVKDMVPDDIQLTSFSILMARYKGDLHEAVKGAHLISRLKENASILISEGCTHHRQCDDIGTVKLPEWIQKYTGKKFRFTHSSGTEFQIQEDAFDLVIHCGGCMLSEREMRSRIEKSLKKSIPVTNYGIAIAHMNGILDRSIRFFLKNQG
ncbi:[FeFe] hydrogenase H-cluster maturation GTPase HydF [Proteiniclasticum sp. SCR006]|uniref:[FeFe] hydrogenase H-cluster maturation GTPase HydF n=1 Tax=Proteiniclasticum aestuarii TaxID=2817862 RepID=A0A939HE71_9CLOT|nr:[FeFe] hydrogenase H-cluster maturation GTPase HydF [Proteiniclasticum aestuarii]MBO1266362.1 [FeFe] hydrogenase H-cluster maturation GTPase HydF [Proteiniclasticum aestuarii]